VRHRRNTHRGFRWLGGSRQQKKSCIASSRNSKALVNINMKQQVKKSTVAAVVALCTMMMAACQAGTQSPGTGAEPPVTTVKADAQDYIPEETGETGPQTPLAELPLLEDPRVYQGPATAMLPSVSVEQMV